MLLLLSFVSCLPPAEDSVANPGGGVVQLGPGEYVTHDSLHMRSRVTLRGAGHTTVLKKAATVLPVISVYEVTDCRIENLTINGCGGGGG